VARHGGPIPLDQLLLERLRQVDDWSQVELQVGSLDQVCERAPGFTERLARLELAPEEATVLLHVDGRTRVKDLVERCRLSTFEVFHGLFRLLQIGLVRTRRAPRGSSLVLCDPDVAGVVEPLAAWCRARSHAPTVVPVDLDRAVERIAGSAPCLAVIADAADGAAEAVARAVRGRLDISDTPLVAVLERWDRGRAAALGRSGFDHVLVKPLHIDALIRLAPTAAATGNPA
jgi:hypothetical protein